MDLFERMKDIFGGDISPFSLRIELLGFEKVGIFGGGKVMHVCENQIVILGKDCEISVCGKNLKIARSENAELYIVGEIDKIERGNSAK